jgi:hypothetical protein
MIEFRKKVVVKNNFLQKPGFSDNSSIPAKILFRNPVSQSHAQAQPAEGIAPV